MICLTSCLLVAVAKWIALGVPGLRLLLSRLPGEQANTARGRPGGGWFLDLLLPLVTLLFQIGNPLTRCG